MTKTHSTTTTKDMETKIHAIMQATLKTWETQFDSKVDKKLSPIHEQIMKTNQLLDQLMANKSIENNFEPHREETSNSRKDYPPS